MNIRFIREAIRLSTEKLSLNQGGPFGAVVVLNNEIVGVGWNRVTDKDNPDPTAHAEIVAIRDACINLHRHSLEGCDIYTSCQPCPMCLGAIYWARIKRVFYVATTKDAANAGFDDELIYSNIEHGLHEFLIPAPEEIRREALGAFQAWDQIVNRTKY